jgi:Domain of unknown function (DUF4190)
MTEPPTGNSRPNPAPYPGHPMYPYTVQPPFNTYAILALVLACVVLPPLGIYFGGQAKKQIAQTGERGIELARAAVIVGWVLTAFMLAVFVLWCAFAVVFLGLFGVVGSGVTTHT